MNTSPIGFRKISVASLEWDFSVRFQEFNIFPKKDGDHEVHVRREKNLIFQEYYMLMYTGEYV